MAQHLTAAEQDMALQAKARNVTTTQVYVSDDVSRLENIDIRLCFLATWQPAYSRLTVASQSPHSRLTVVSCISLRNFHFGGSFKYFNHSQILF